MPLASPSAVRSAYHRAGSLTWLLSLPFWAACYGVPQHEQAHWRQPPSPVEERPAPVLAAPLHAGNGFTLFQSALVPDLVYWLPGRLELLSDAFRSPTLLALETTDDALLFGALVAPPIARLREASDWVAANKPGATLRALPVRDRRVTSVTQLPVCDLNLSAIPLDDLSVMIFVSAHSLPGADAVRDLVATDGGFLLEYQFKIHVSDGGTDTLRPMAIPILLGNAVLPTQACKR